jgi:hypothetical protein
MVGGRGVARWGKVKSTCCRVHKNAELVPDSSGTKNGIFFAYP